MGTTLLLALMLPAAPTEPADVTAVAEVLRGVLVQKIPSPAVSTKHNWGHQREVITGYDLKRRGPLNWDGRPRKEMKNDGHWTHLTVSIEDPDRNVHLELTDIKSPEPGRLTFSSAVRSPSVRLNVKQQMWKLGVRVFSNETRAVCKAAVHMDCEVTHRLNMQPGSSLPDLILTMKVHKAEVFYKDLRIEHTLGMGGDAAKVVGEATHNLLTRLKPSIERDLQAKANAAIVKAADGKEYRVELAKLIQ